MPGALNLPGNGRADRVVMGKRKLGRYQVEMELGQGAMGVVCLGRDPLSSFPVALKIMALPQGLPAHDLAEVKQRFFREAETAGRLDHPHIVSIYDAGEDHDLAYIAMEFLKGSDLVRYTKPGSLLPLPRVTSIVARVAEALAYAHRQHVVHRDVKPANIMWEPESDTVKVTDFGIARLTESRRTRAGLALGSPAYMSPEQLARGRIEAGSDLYSLGVTFYQLACGRLPFEGESVAELMFKIANDPPFNIMKLRPELPPCLAGVIYKAMMKNPEERFRDGDEMAQALRDCAARVPAGAAA